MVPATRLELILRRDRLLVIVAVIVLTVLAAGYTVLGVGMPMTAYDMTRLAGRMMMAAPEWTPGYFVLVFLMWWVMMIAMMMPAAAPVVLLHAAICRQSPGEPSLGLTAIFVSGYLAVWGGFSVVATAAQWVLELRQVLDPSEMAFASRLLGATVLVAAGVYQLTPIKRACLDHCRSPVAILVNHRRPGRRGAFLMGVEHGAYCLGCCWALMALLFFGGIMNLYWIAGLAIFVLTEKVLPHGDRLGRMAGAVLVGWGAWLAATASGL